MLSPRLSERLSRRRLCALGWDRERDGDYVGDFRMSGWCLWICILIGS